MADKASSTDDHVDLDHHSAAFLANRHEHYAELRRACPVVWNERYGYWLVTDYESVAAVARDAETFSHTFAPEEGLQGICGVPRSSAIPRQGVSEIDGASHADLRRVLNPYFAPHEVARRRPRAQELAARFLDEVIESGEADLVGDYATPIPAVLTLEMMGMPSDNWRHYAEFFHASSSYDRRSPEFTAAAGRWPEMMAELVGFARQRRAAPGDDITSALVTSPLDGRVPTDDEVGNIMWNLVAGGIDTTTSLTSWALHQLGTDTDARGHLQADRSLLPTAIEEYLRRYSPNETLTRTATQDVELGGRRIARGDVVMISWVSANHDESVFDRADDVVLDRAPNKHIAFGAGRHRCIGAHLARMETEVMLTEVLDRIPDYVVDIDRFRPAPGNVLMNTVVSMPVTFTPGRRR